MRVSANASGVRVTLLPELHFIPRPVAVPRRAGWHLRNVNVGRDYSPDVVADVANARAGDGCPVCGAPVLP